MNNATYFVIYSNTSRNGTAGLRPQVMWAFEDSIKNAAAWELNRSGKSLEEMAGVEWVEGEDGNFTPARELTAAEVLSLSIDKLGDDGRMYCTFSTDAAGAAEFIAEAEACGLGDEAHAIVEQLA